MRSSRILLSIAMLFMLPALSIAQSDMGECGFDDQIGSETLSNSMFSYDGIEFDEFDLPTSIQQALFDARLKHYKEQLSILNSAVLDLELEKRASSSGKTRDDLMRELLAVTAPSDTTIEAFYKANKAQIPYPLEKVRDQIIQMLIQQQAQAKQQALLESIKVESNFKVTLSKPVAPYAEINLDGFPSKGPADARVTLVEFADYQCPHCKRAASALRNVRDRFPDDLRVVFMDFPVNSSGISRTVALGAACADNQGEFWDYHDLAFDRQSELNSDSPSQLASELGLDTESFNSCMKSNFPLSRVASSENEAKRLGLNGTPTFFLNGRRLHLHDTESGLIEEISKELSRGSQS